MQSNLSCKASCLSIGHGQISERSSVSAGCHPKQLFQGKRGVCVVFRCGCFISYESMGIGPYGLGGSGIHFRLKHTIKATQVLVFLFGRGRYFVLLN